MFRQLQITLFIGLTVLISLSAQSAKPQLCSRALLSPEELHNAVSRDKYLETEDFHHDNHIDSFKKAVKHHSELLLGKERTINYAVRFYNDSSFTFTVFDRYKILIDRKIPPQVREGLEQKYSVIGEVSQRTGPFLSRKESLDDRKLLLLELLQPPIDGLNVTSKKERKNWNRATEFLIDLIQQKKKMTRYDLYSLALVLQGDHPNHPASGANFLSDLDINYMLRKGPKGKKILDPTLSFIPGSVKSDALDDLFNFIDKNEKKMNPVELAAQVRMRIVSIHPIPDRNGRLARLMANYILMRAGLPPAAIPRGEDGSSSVVLFPLKKFDDQIAPEKSYQIMLDGVARSQRFLLGQQNDLD